jgi:hypothetical protein
VKIVLDFTTILSNQRGSVRKRTFLITKNHPRRAALLGRKEYDDTMYSFGLKPLRKKTAEAGSKRKKAGNTSDPSH